MNIMQLRQAIRSLPFAPSAYALLRLLRGRNARFVADYQRNSGAGSDLQSTKLISDELPALLRSLEVRALLDIPCGDFLWMQHVDLGSIAYTGGDIIEPLIASHQTRHTSSRRTFQRLDIVTSDLPTVDVIFCRDCLVHFSHRLAKKALQNVRRSRSKYLLTTTFPHRTVNAGIVTGDWQPLNLCAAPFNFPPPLRLFNEGHPPPYADKSLGLWRIDDLPALDQ